MKIIALILLSVLVIAAAPKNHEDFHNGNYGKKTAFRAERNNPYIHDIKSKRLRSVKVDYPHDTKVARYKFRITQ